MSRVLIFGSTRGVGLELARFLFEPGAKVGTLVRADSDISQIETLGVDIYVGDAFSQDDVNDTFQRFKPDIVVSTLGGRDVKGRRVDSTGNINVIRGAQKSGAKRLILVTSLGCGESYSFMSERAKEAFGEALLAKTKAEDYLRSTDLNWSIIRPGGLRNGESTRGGALWEVADLHGYIYRKDVAELVVKILDNPASFRRVLVALDATDLRTALDPQPKAWCTL